jgi:hypothetical protein
MEVFLVAMKFPLRIQRLQVLRTLGRTYHEELAHLEHSVEKKARQ